MLDSLSRGNYSVRIMSTSQLKELENFQNITDVLKINLEPGKLNKMVQLINLESAEFYKTVIVYQNGKPVATGSLNITQVPIFLKKPDDDDYVDPRQIEIDEPYQNFRAVIQYIMVDQEHLNSPKKDVTI